MLTGRTIPERVKHAEAKSKKRRIEYERTYGRLAYPCTCFRTHRNCRIYRHQKIQFRAFVLLTVSDAVCTDPWSNPWNRENDSTEDDDRSITVYWNQRYDADSKDRIHDRTEPRRGCQSRTGADPSGIRKSGNCGFSAPDRRICIPYGTRGNRNLLLYFKRELPCGRCR